MSYQEGIRAAGVTRTFPSVRTITPRDLIEVLSKGLDDFRAMPSHAIFLGLFYAIAGLVIAEWAFRYDLVPLLYPPQLTRTRQIWMGAFAIAVNMVVYWRVVRTTLRLRRR